PPDDRASSDALRPPSGHHVRAPTNADALAVRDQSVGGGASRATRPCMYREPSVLDAAFRSVLFEICDLRDDVDFDEWCRHLRAVDAALVRLCDAIDAPRAGDLPLEQLARRAFVAVLALAQLLHGAYSEDDRIAQTIESTRRAVRDLLDALDPYITP